MSRLPQEIINLIVDAISTRNRADLSLVALSSRVFLHQAQSHLFRSVKLEISYCIQQNSEDLDVFHAILLQSPNIKFYIQEICLNGLVFCHVAYHRTHPRSWPCPHHWHAGRQQQHFLSRKVVENFHFRNIPCLVSIITMLSHLRAIRLNYGPKSQMDWRYALTRGGQTVISLFCFEQSITTLTLSSLINVPMAVMDSILQLSQLTTLIFDDVLLDDTESVLRRPRQSQLTNLYTFGFVRAGYFPGPPSVKDITEIAALIVNSTSQTLRKLIWSDQLEDNVEILQHLINLRTISTGARERHYQITLRSIILRIIASNLQTIEVLELFDMEEASRRESIEKVCECWTELDGLLEDQAFSNLKEIRLLFHTFRNSDDLARHDPPLMYTLFTTEEVVSIFESCLLKSSARGIRITYNLTHGRDGLLERY